MKAHVLEFVLCDEPLVETILEVSGDDILIGSDNIDCVLNMCRKCWLLVDTVTEFVKHKTNLLSLAFSVTERLLYSSLVMFLEDTFLASMHGLAYLICIPKSETLATTFCLSSSSILA